MHYELYIDLFFLVNFFMDYLLLMITGKMLRCRRKRLRIILGAGIGAFLGCVWIVLFRGKIWKLIVFHGVANFIMLKTGLEIKEKYIFLRAWIVLYASAFVLGGIMNIFQPYIRIGLVFIVVAFLSYHMCLGIWNILSYLRRNQSGSCKVQLYRHGRKCELVALIDTGNKLRDDLTGRPVHVIAGEMASRLGCVNTEKQRNITFHSIGRENGTMPIFIMDRLCCQCESEEKWIEKPVVAVSEEQKLSGIYDMILNPDDL